ncbi:MAG: PorP/SprF family type IX secretion system membrane protein [Microscillaceae bacterium]|nr:PorP/SprF family type IX secretion system membrane protein [Microscillaceae bacterium]
MMKHAWVIFVGLMLGMEGKHLLAQDLAFSQYQNHPLLHNPAEVGLKHRGTLSLAYRRQPIASGALLSTPVLEASLALIQKNRLAPFAGLGLLILRDEAGDFLTTQGLAIALNPQFHRGFHHFSLGGQLGWFQTRFSSDNVTTDNQYRLGFFDPEADLNEAFDNLQIGFLTWHLGFRWTWTDAQGQEKAFLGLSGRNLNRAPLEFTAGQAARLPAHFQLSAGVSLPFSPRLTLAPQVRATHRADFNFATFGTWLHYNWGLYEKAQLLSAGAGLHTQGAAWVGLEWQANRYRLSLGYDLPLRDQTNVWMGNGATEIGFTLFFPPHLPKPMPPVPILDELPEVAYQPILVSLPPFSTKADKKDLPRPNQLREVQNNTQNSKVREISRDLPTEIKLLHARSVQFAFRQDTLSPAYQQYLDQVYGALQKYPEVRLVVSGHSCDIGLPEENLRLSQERANFVKTYLTRLGIAPERIIPIGLGDRLPRLPNISEGNRQKNRRVEFEFIFSPEAEEASPEE